MKLSAEQLEIVLQEIVRLRVDHPKANVYYDTELGGIQVVYPLPKDFYKMNLDRNFGDDL